MLADRGDCQISKYHSRFKESSGQVSLDQSEPGIFVSSGLSSDDRFRLNGFGSPSAGVNHE
jgi:hypothetical protein